ncbi:MAG TPA: hypothetical protein VFT99_12085 [Roseiflexaceae bacterium]|nr:hypothetical protein [Roseiflexaceae bacterium]
MKNTILTVVAVLLAAFPFVTVISELVRTEQMITILVFVGIALVLSLTVIAAFTTTRTGKP